MAHQVFVSHAAEDREVASHVCDMLEAEGIGCWMAPRDLKEGTDPAAGTLDGIRTSDLVLLIFSTSANSSPYVLREIERAVAYDRPVLSLHIDDVVPSASIEYYLNLWQWLEVRGGVEGKQGEILAAVRGQLTRAQAAVERPAQDGMMAAATGDETGASAGEKAARPKRWNRRTWAITLAALLVIAAATVGGIYASSPPSHNFWTKLDPQGTLPQARAWQAMAYDPDTGRVIMFGGSLSAANANDTWVYDPAASTWTRIRPSGALPPGRFCHSMAYDPSTHRLFLFGGSCGDGGDFNDEIGGVLDDTWAYNPTTNTWGELTPAGHSPVGRADDALAYDPTSGRVIMFGGFDDFGVRLNDTWAYDPVANRWTDLSPQGTLPPARSAQAMAYDPTSGRVIMFGGLSGSPNPSSSLEGLYDTWAYDPVANTWTNLSPSGPRPPASWWQSMVFDPSSGRLIMFVGGATGRNLNETWAYDSATNTWTKLDPGGALPAARIGQSMVFDPSTGRPIMFGGSGDSFLNDTWAYTP